MTGYRKIGEFQPEVSGLALDSEFKSIERADASKAEEITKLQARIAALETRLAAVEAQLPQE